MSIMFSQVGTCVIAFENYDSLGMKDRDEPTILVIIQK